MVYTCACACVDGLNISFFVRGGPWERKRREGKEKKRKKVERHREQKMF